MSDHEYPRDFSPGGNYLHHPGRSVNQERLTVFSIEVQYSYPGVQSRLPSNISRRLPVSLYPEAPLLRAA